MANNTKIDISYDDKILIASGSFFTFGDNETALDIRYQGDDLHFRFKFDRSPTHPGPSIHYGIENSDTLIITLYNLDKYPAGLYSIKPLDVGTIKNRSIYLIYHVVPLRNTEMYQIIYSFYLRR